MNKLPSLIMALFFMTLCVKASYSESSLAVGEVSSDFSLADESLEVNKISKRIAAQKRPLKVAVVDTGLDRNDPRFSKVLCKMGHRNFVTGSTNTYDSHGHGTHIAGLIKQNAGEGGYCLVILKYFDENADSQTNFQNSIAAFRWAAQIGVDIVNFSAGGPTANPLERQAIASSVKTVFVVAAGNEAKDMTLPENRYYPASYELPNLFVVGNVNQAGTRSPSSNYGDPRIIWEVGEKVRSTMPCVNSQGGLHYDCEGDMTGTSQATAVHTGKLIKKVLRR